MTPATNNTQLSDCVQSREGRTWMLARSAGWMRFFTLEFLLRCELHVCRVHSEPHPLLFALNASIGIQDGHVIHRLNVLTQQRMMEAELAHQIHLLLHARTRGELQGRL